MWRNAYKIQWAVEGKFLCVKAIWEEERFFLPPFGPEEGLTEVLAKMMDHAAEQGFPFMFQGVEKYMVEWLEKIKPGYFLCCAERDNFDYVYLSKDLIELKGRKYHTKKNHVNGFKKKYSDYEYVPMTVDMMDQCIAFMAEWCTERGCVKGDSIDCERKAIVEALNNFTVLGFQGAAIFIGGKMVGFTYGEASTHDTVVIHVEKGLLEYKSVYGVINQEFCTRNWQNFEYINREEDMGIEGLRKAKESYHPIKMVEKYIITVKS